MAQTLPKELPKAVMADHLPVLLKSIKSMNGGHPSSWIQWRNDAIGDDVKSFILDRCHADMKYTGPGWTDLITAVPLNDEASLTYTRMLIHGPFKSMSDQIYLIEENKQHYLYLSNLDRWPANVLYNICIASRAPLEHKVQISKFMKLLEEGYNPTLAALLSFSTNGGVRRTFQNFGHYWLDAGSDWSLVMDGVFHKPSVSFAKNPDACTPCNVIWGLDKNVPKMLTMSDKEIANMYEMPPFIPPKIEPPKLMKKKIGGVWPNHGPEVDIQPAGHWAHPQPMEHAVAAFDQAVANLQAGQAVPDNWAPNQIADILFGNPVNEQPMHLFDEDNNDNFN